MESCHLVQCDETEEDRNGLQNPPGPHVFQTREYYSYGGSCGVSEKSCFNNQLNNFSIPAMQSTHEIIVDAGPGDPPVSFRLTVNCP